MTLGSCCESAAPTKIAGFGLIGVALLSALAMAPWTWMKPDQMWLIGWCALLAGSGWVIACRCARKAVRHTN